MLRNNGPDAFPANQAPRNESHPIRQTQVLPDWLLELGESLTPPRVKPSIPRAAKMHRGRVRSRRTNMFLMRWTKTPSERKFMHTVHIAVILAAASVFSASPVLSQGASQPGQPCPDKSATVRSGNHAGNSAGNAASEQGVEHSAILPSAGGEGSAAPTVKKDGQEVDATECSKPPNQLKK